MGTLSELDRYSNQVVRQSAQEWEEDKEDANQEAEETRETGKSGRKEETEQEREMLPEDRDKTDWQLWLIICTDRKEWMVCACVPQAGTCSRNADQLKQKVCHTAAYLPLQHKLNTTRS